MKEIYKSKTIWINIATIVTAALTERLTELIEPYIEISVLAVLNIALRLITKESVSL